jgi:hypothetical protein
MSSVNKVILLGMQADYSRGMSLSALAEKYPLSISTIRKRLIELGTPMRNRSEWMKDYPDLGARTRGKKRVFTDEHKANMKLARQKWAEANAIGRSKKPSGYVEITRGPNKNRGEHRVIMEGVVGRPLTRDEWVHHVDTDRAHNDPSNLEIKSPSEHNSLHRLQEIAEGRAPRRDENGRFCQ